MIRKKDILLIVILLAIAGIGLLVVSHLQKEDGDQVTITIGGEVYGTYDLNEDQTIEIDEDGYNKVVIEDGYVYMAEADCPDQYCVEHAEIHYENQTIICLPHELVVEITSGESSQVDIVTQ